MPFGVRCGHGQEGFEEEVQLNGRVEGWQRMEGRNPRRKARCKQEGCEEEAHRKREEEKGSFDKVCVCVCGVL